MHINRPLPFYCRFSGDVTHVYDAKSKKLLSKRGSREEVIAIVDICNNYDSLISAINLSLCHRNMPEEVRKVLNNMLIVVESTR